MKKVTLFYLEHCPHCKRAISTLETYLKEEKYQGIEIQRIEESKQPALADQYDYYYVPTFYVEDQKRAEGVLTEQQILDVLNEALC